MIMKVDERARQRWAKPRTPRATGGGTLHDRPTEAPWWGRPLRRVLAGAFHRIGRTRFDVTVHGLAHFTNRPRTLIIANHKSAYDLILLAPLLYRAGRGRGPIGRLAFVAAEEMFQPGYVSTHLLRADATPRGLSRLLYRADLSALLQALRAYLVPRPGARQLGILLREARCCFGDVRLNRLLRDDPARHLPGLHSTARIHDALQWRHHRALTAYHALRTFQPPVAAVLRQRAVEEIHACLDCFARLLNHGDALFIAPEGALSHDGGFQPTTAAARRLLQRVDRPITVLPVNITYDWTHDTTAAARERPSAFITVGEELTVDGAHAAGALDAVLQRVIPALTTLTLPQLAAHCAQQLDGQRDHPVMDEDALKRMVREQARAWAARGGRIDPRLTTGFRFERHWERFMAHCKQRGALWRTREERVQLNHERVPAHPGRDGLWRDHAAELRAAGAVMSPGRSGSFR